MNKLYAQTMHPAQVQMHSHFMLL